MCGEEEVRELRPEGWQEAVVRPLRQAPWGRAAGEAQDVRGLVGRYGLQHTE